MSEQEEIKLVFKRFVYVISICAVIFITLLLIK